MTTDTDPRVAAEIAAFQKHYGPSEFANDPLNPRREAFGHGFREGLVAKVTSAPVGRICTHPPGCTLCAWCGFRATTPPTGKTENEIDRLETEVARLNAELQEVRKDADRYRWLREQAWFAGPLCVLRDPKDILTRGAFLGADCPSLSRLDDAIDAAMTKEK